MKLLYKIINVYDVFNLIFIHEYVFLRKCHNRYDVALSILDMGQVFGNFNQNNI